MEPERLFSFTWHPYAIDPNADYSGEPATLVEFRLNRRAAARSSPSPRLASTPFQGSAFEAYRMNEAGWTEQLQNIEAMSSRGLESRDRA